MALLKEDFFNTVLKTHLFFNIIEEQHSNNLAGSVRFQFVVLSIPPHLIGPGTYKNPGGNQMFDLVVLSYLQCC